MENPIPKSQPTGLPTSLETRRELLLLPLRLKLKHQLRSLQHLSPPLLLLASNPSFLLLLPSLSLQSSRRLLLPFPCSPSSSSKIEPSSLRPLTRRLIPLLLYRRRAPRPRQTATPLPLLLLRKTATPPPTSPCRLPLLPPSSSSLLSSSNSLLSSNSSLSEPRRRIPSRRGTWPPLPRPRRAELPTASTEEERRWRRMTIPSRARWRICRRRG